MSDQREAPLGGTWPNLCLGRAFVDGARWLFFKERSATLFPSERDEAEAERRYADLVAAPVAPAERPVEELLSLMENFNGWWHLNREGSVNATYARIDTFTKESSKALEAFDSGAPAERRAEPDLTALKAVHRYTITSEGASKGYFRLVEDADGAWVTWAEVDGLVRAALSARAPQEP